MNLQKMTVGATKTLLLTALLLCLTQSLTAQTPEQSEEKITLSKQSITVRELFEEIERQTGLTIIVRENSVNDNAIVEIPQNSSVGEILSQVLAGTDKGWQFSGKYIVIGTRPKTIETHPNLQPQTQSQTDESIVIDRDELKRFVAQRVALPDTVSYRIIEAEPFHFDSEDRTFLAPGKETLGGEVVPPFTTAERWQRSKLVLKTNLLYGAAALAPNLRGEIGLGNRTTFELGASYNGWNLKGSPEDNRKLVHGVVLGEFRYWLCERFNGHYFGLHAFGGFYNVSGKDVPLLFEKEYRYEGTHYGAGISYGYMLPLSPRWGVEFNVGIGVAQMNYDKYGCGKCDNLEGEYRKTYFGPTRAGVNFVFIIR